jgi:cytochrome P450
MRWRPSVIGEVLRWTSAATHVRVTGSHYGIHRQRNPSASRDEEVFPEPDQFFVGRHPNRHRALSIGEHFCLGASLVRAQLLILYDGLLHRVEHAERRGSTA